MFAVCQTNSSLLCDGRVAQLGERIHGMDEVAGSIPVTSTNFQSHPLRSKVRTSTFKSLRKRAPSFCHSERSEESLFLFLGLNRREIPRFARNDKIGYFFRSLLSRITCCGSLIFPNLFQNFGSEAGERIVFHAVSNLNRVAADFTILDVRLTANRKVQHHRNFFSAIRAMEEMLHRN
jgi:hypothetical protein